MPVCCAVCLFSLQVFGLVNILVMTLVCRVRIFQRSVEQVHSGLVARIQEAVHEELDSEKKLTEEQRGIRGWLVGRRMTEEASIDGVELKERNMSRGDSFVQQRALEYDERFQRAQKVQRIVEVHSATAPYAELHHEAAGYFREPRGPSSPLRYTPHFRNPSSKKMHISSETMVYMKVAKWFRSTFVSKIVKPKEPRKLSF